MKRLAAFALLYSLMLVWGATRQDRLGLADVLTAGLLSGLLFWGLSWAANASAVWGRRIVRGLIGLICWAPIAGLFQIIEFVASRGLPDTTSGLVVAYGIKFVALVVPVGLTVVVMKLLARLLRRTPRLLLPATAL